MKKLFDFECSNCSDISEHFWDESIDLPICKKCGTQLTKLPSMVAFAFVRSRGGTYGTDTPSHGAISFANRRC
jgi:predicted nucleic acid-binding Zn ribbon protein